MKKDATGKTVKLTLSKETLRSLDAKRLEPVAGGISYEYCSVTCLSACSLCDN